MSWLLEEHVLKWGSVLDARSFRTSLGAADAHKALQRHRACVRGAATRELDCALFEETLTTLTLSL